MKYLIWIVVLAVVWWVWSKRNAAQARGAAPAVDRPVERMVTCAQCGVYLPESDAVVVGDRHYCSPAHRDQASTDH